jgi:galactose-1-phosphate uridylyltransferase
MKKMSLLNIDKKRTSCKRSLKPKMHAEALKIPLSTFYRNSDLALTRRWKMTNLVDLETWSSIPKRKGYTKITSDVKKALIEWIVQHENIKHSSSKKEVINVKLDGCVDKVPMQKLYMQISFRELHADLLKLPQEGDLKWQKIRKGK